MRGDDGVDLLEPAGLPVLVPRILGDAPGQQVDDAVEPLLQVAPLLLKREDLGSTGIGNGVAVPHTKHPSVSKLIATVALTPGGVDFASLDGEQVHILILLISPPDRPGDHLRGLENISRHLRNQNFCKFLMQARTQDAVWDLLKEADNNEI